MRQFDLSQHTALAWMMLLDRWATCTGVAINGYIIILHGIIIGSCTCPEMNFLPMDCHFANQLPLCHSLTTGKFWTATEQSLQ